MLRHITGIILLGSLVLALGCATNKKVNNPIANVDSKQPDKVLFDRAMDAMKHNHYDVARLTLQTLINTYPDSEYIARAKLAIADSWYDEGGSASLAQAEAEYKDFETFFPNMPEAAEAQLKIANIHYQQMEKPDRDYTHALRAEEEYRQLILQYPDNPLVPEAKQKLRDVEEVIAEREYRVGRFYYLRQSYPAAIARLKSLADKYPLYSKADEALYLLGQSYEGEINMVRLRPSCTSLNPPQPAGCMLEAAKAAMIQDFTKGATEAYSRIITRYPVMDRADDAKARLIGLHEPVPRPTKQAVAQNKAEEDSRKEPSTVSKVLTVFEKHPNVKEASKVGDPPLTDPQPMSASQVVQEATRAGIAAASDSHSVSVETVGKGTPPPDQPAPRSDAPLATGGGSAPENSTAASNAAAAADSTAAAPTQPAQPDPNELKPNVPADPNELKPNVPDNSAPVVPPPQQVNEIQTGSGQGSAAPVAGGVAAPAAAAASNDTSASASSSSQQDQEDDSTTASSKKKKKKGIHKVVPF
jgi:outer membrane protein assembly factor BamD